MKNNLAPNERPQTGARVGFSRVGDPRPLTIERDGETLLAGVVCLNCHRTSAGSPARCPSCGGPVEARTFGPRGTIWACTVIEVAVAGKSPPNRVAYVDLAEGPRILAHVTGSSTKRLPAGTDVVLEPMSDAGDLQVRAS